VPRTYDDSSDQPIGFGSFQLYPATRILKKDMDPVDIGGRAFYILIALLRRPNEVVTKRELFELVWPNINVDDGSLRTRWGRRGRMRIRRASSRFRLCLRISSGATKQFGRLVRSC
jgi:DNA-binding response OmpR family regulator